jgi:hypothetical protein
MARGSGLKLSVFDGGARPRLSSFGFKKSFTSFTSSSSLVQLLQMAMN